MQCFYHQDREASAICSDCGKGLCAQCAAVFDPSVCPSCASARSSANTTGEIIKIMVKSAVFFAISFVFFYLVVSHTESQVDTSGLVMMSIIASGIPWGWGLISRIFPYSAGGNVSFMVCFYLFKLIAAYLVGIFVMAWNIIKILFYFIKRLIEKRSIRKVETRLRNDFAAPAVQAVALPAENEQE